MKTFLKTSLLTTGILAAITALNAATTDTAAAPAPAATATAPAHPARQHMAKRRLVMRHHLAKRLGLTPDQVAKLKTERAGTAASIKSIRADNSLTPDQKKAKIRDVVKTARTDMRSVLTPDQQAKLDALRARSKAHRA